MQQQHNMLQEVAMELDAEDSAAAIGNAGDMQQQGAPEELLPNDPFGNGDGHAAWVRLQLQQMLQDATEIVEDEADDTTARRLSEQDKQRLQAAFRAAFADQLQQQECPAEQQVRAWLRSQLGIAQHSYDDGDDDAAPPGDQHTQGAASATQHRQQQQQQQQVPRGQGPRARQKQGAHGREQQQGDAVRRSSRSNKGQMGFEYAAIFGGGTQLAKPAAKGATGDKGGGKGRGSDGAPQQRRQQQQPTQPLTPANPAPPPRRRAGAAIQ
jgi:hypothetical protein